MDAFEVLGVHPTADQAEVDDAYRLAYAERITGPDDPAREAIDRAYVALADPAARAELARNRHGQPVPVPPAPPAPWATPAVAPVAVPHPATPPDAGQWRPRPAVGFTLGPAAGAGCKACGSTPTAHFSFGQNTGMLFARQYRTASGRFCRDCARHIGRTFQNHNLLFGWFGVVSFFSTLIYAFGNASGLRQAGRLGEPQPADARRADPGRSLFLRPAGILLVLGVLALVFLATVAILSPTPR